MNEETLNAQTDALLSITSHDLRSGAQLLNGTITLVNAVYGPNSTQLRTLLDSSKDLVKPGNNSLRIGLGMGAIHGVLRSLKNDIELGLIRSLQAQFMGAVLTDFIGLAKHCLTEQTDAAKNIAAVLAAASFEDTMRRLANLSGIPHFEKLADVVDALKTSGKLLGAQVGIAQSFLSFRNRALHAKWAEINLPEVHSVIAFVEQILMKEFC